MVLTLDNGTNITIYEKSNLLKQLKPYIDKEIYELLEDNYGYKDKCINKDLKIVTDTEDLEGETIKYCNLFDNGDLDNIIIATNEGGLFIGNVEGGDEYSCPSIYCISNKQQLKYKIFANTDVRNELLKNNIINQEYINQINLEREQRLKDEEKAREKQEYEKYLKMKEKFEGEMK